MCNCALGLIIQTPTRTVLPVLDLLESASKLWGMSMPLEDVAREAIGLPRHQRLSLARLLIELDDAGSDDDVEEIWEAEIEARLQAVKEGRVQGIPYEEVLARINRRLSP